MGRALYRTYRSKSLAEIVGQEHITTALARALTAGTISHAYLFTGPRGTGKTSIARILAHEINGLAYEDDANHLDIIEIDAASNRRIDEIRELRDKVHITPTSAKYKVYIIDEVHMLTKEAFNALLKTLEEPPAHVVFILATTEAHKLPETIISRTQRYAFKPVDHDKVVGHLRTIAEAEHIAIDDDALDLIAAHGEGSFRDSISLLDQVRNSGDKVTLAAVQGVLGIAPLEVIEAITDAVSTHDAPRAIAALQSARTAGHEPARMAKQLGESLRSALLAGQPPLPHDVLLQLLAKLIEVPASSNPASNLEIAVLDATLAGAPQPAAKSKTPKVMPEEVQAKPPVQIDPHPATARKRAQESTATPSPLAAPEPAQKTSDDEPDTPLSDATLDDSAWPTILEAIKKRHNTLYSIVRTTKPHFAPGSVTLECAYAFHQKKLNDKTSKATIGDIIASTTGHNLQVISILGEAGEPPVVPPSLPPSDEQVHNVAAAQSASAEVAAISNIFGSAEVLES